MANNFLVFLSLLINDFMRRVGVFPLYSFIFICCKLNVFVVPLLVLCCFSVFSSFSQVDVLLWLSVFTHLCRFPVRKELGAPVRSYWLLPFVASLGFPKTLCVNCLHLPNSVFVNVDGGLLLFCLILLWRFMNSCLDFLVSYQTFWNMSGDLKCPWPTLCACMMTEKDTGLFLWLLTSSIILSTEFPLSSQTRYFQHICPAPVPQRSVQVPLIKLLREVCCFLHSWAVFSYIE